MVTKNTGLETTLHLKRTFAAPREKVFRAWTDPEELKKWWGPEGFSTPSAQIDLRVGGKYRFAMKPPEGEIFYFYGIYREVRAPEKLVFTWNREGPVPTAPCGATNSTEGGAMDIGETLVTVEFRDFGGSTEVVLTHEFFPNEKERDGHNKGWSGSFDRLANIL